MATEKGSLPILEFLLANDSSEDNKVQWGAASVQQALRHDHLDVVHWLYKNTSQTETTEEQHKWTIKAAMDADDIEFCQSLMPKGACILDYTEYCATPQMIEWKFDSEYFKRGEYGAVVAIRDLAATDQLDLMNRIPSEHNPPPEDSGWPPEGCSSNAMDFAAANGHLEIGRWLHLNTSAGCTSDAMDLAAAGGHLNVLKWLRENRNEGCTVGAIEQTLSNGFLASSTIPRASPPIRFIAELRELVWRTFAMLNDVPILEWLKHNYPVPDMPEGQRDRHFAGLADRILGNIAQQITGQLGGAVHVNVVRGQQGAGQAEPDGVLGMMNNFVVFARGNNDDANNDDESSSEDDDE
ncbi:hypothetical protein PI126_g7988 [Phytophthora idaei]|nr:hypothetical protein PI126_g7988 [Phytophthora idaei]